MFLGGFIHARSGAHGPSQDRGVGGDVEYFSETKGEATCRIESSSAIAVKTRNTSTSSASICASPWGMTNAWRSGRIPKSRQAKTGTGGIQTALEECKIAVLLVSTDFLDSEYIREQELPVFLGRWLQEKLILTSLFVRPSVADEREFPVEIPGKDETQRVRITQFQGLNRPERPLSQLSESEQELTLLHADRTIRDLALRPYQARGSRGDRDQRRFELLWIWSAGGKPSFAPSHCRIGSGSRLSTRTRASARKNSSSGMIPANLCHPKPYSSSCSGADADKASRILLDAFEIPHDGALPNQTVHPLRIRLRTDDPIW